MRYWCELPFELLNIIFLHLKTEESSAYTWDLRHLAQCVLTCRAWKVPAQAIYFSTVRFITAKDFQRIYKVACKNETISKSVKSLRCTSTYNFNVITLDAIDMLFPNLEKICFGDNIYSYTSFSRILTKNKRFKNLKTVPDSTNTEQYLNCLNYIKDQVSEIEFEDSSNRNSRYSYLCDKFGDYPRLKKIIIKKYTSSDLKFEEGFQLVERIMKNDNMLSLQELTIKLSYSSSDGAFSLITKGRETLLPTNRLKNLYLRVPSPSNISEEFLSFIMNKFTHLNNFRLEGNIVHASKINQSLSSAFLNFMKFLYVLPNFFIQEFSTQAETSLNLLEDLYTTMEKKSTSPLLLRSCSITLLKTNGSYEEGWTFLGFENINMKIQNLDVKIKCKIRISGVSQEQIEYIKRTGRFFHKMSLQAISPKNLTALLEKMLTHCTQLEHLDISGWELKSKESQKNVGSTNKRIRKVKTLVLRRFDFFPVQLRSIVTHFPNLKSLILNNCFIHKPAAGDKLFFLVCLPNMSLEYLEINMDKNFIDVTAKKEKDYHIKLVTDMGQKPKYCSFRVEYNIANNKIIGYTLVEFTPETFDENIAYRRLQSCLIYCKSVKKVIIKYIDAESGRQKEVDLLSVP